MEFGTTNELAPLNPNDYSWEQSSVDPAVRQRPALAGESMWIHRAQELRGIFLCSSLTLNPPISRRTFSTSLQRAWKLLRFKIPELGVGTSRSGTHGKSFMQYHTIDDEDAQRWVIRTHSCQSGSHKLDFEVLRTTLLAARQGNNSFENVFLLSHTISDDGSEPLTLIQIMICIDHQISDGIGARIIFGKLLELLAFAIGNVVSLETDIKWEDSRHNLSQPWICCMNEHQVISGSEYEARAALNRDVILNKMKHNPGLSLLQGVNSSKQETHFLILTPQQTTALLQAIKHVVGRSSNITHLGHTAMVLALLRRIHSASLTPSSILYSPCWLNGRRYLLAASEDKIEPAKSYVPICQSFAPIMFIGLQELVLDSSAKKREVRDVLVRACRAATAEYEKIKEMKSMLPGCVVLFEELGMAIGMAKRGQGISEQDDAVATQERGDISDTPIPTADPFFLSDGMTEQYISHSYPSPPPNRHQTLNTLPTPIFTVDDIQFAAHAEKNLIVRMSSWRGKTTISGEWRSCHFDRDMVVTFLEDVVVIMMAIVD